ncbi:MAG: PDDEXK nuclease domain-containing protein [bacterium]|nr:PDDEXK nuclease domain-containing protein [bacterium]
MNYYNEIKKKLINNEVYKKVKDYSKNKSDLTTYYNVGKLLYEAGNKYGECIIKEYSNKLIIDVGKKYNERTLRRMRQFFKMFNNEKWSPLATKLTWSHYTELLPIKDKNKLLYYLNISINQNLSRNDLRNRIKTNEYERLDETTKQKLIKKDKEEVQDFIKNPIIIKNSTAYDEISEKVLKQLILEDIDNFLTELGEGFSYIKNEYKIKLGDRYNYIDLLLYNINFNCYVVVELKITELKKEHIGQIKLYMNYIDKNIKTINQDKTIGIIICKKDNKFVMEYCSDSRIFRATYILN